MYPEQHKLKIYSEAKWWHHPPKIPDLPGTREVNRVHLFLPLLYGDAPDLVEQTIQAFEKIWANREAVAKLPG